MQRDINQPNTVLVRILPSCSGLESFPSPQRQLKGMIVPTGRSLIDIAEYIIWTAKAKIYLLVFFAIFIFLTTFTLTVMTGSRFFTFLLVCCLKLLLDLRMKLALFALGNEEFDDSVDPVQAVDKREKADKEDHAGA